MEIISKSLHKAPIEKNFYENSAWKNNQVICGIDEVGRSCLAGPLVTAAVILPCRKDYSLLKDSKALSLKQRIEAFNWIKKNCWYTTALVNHIDIDKNNIYQSTLKAMLQSAIHILKISAKKPSSFVIDAMPVNLKNTAYTNLPIYFFYKGESYSTSIAAASIVAKVTRDKLIAKYDKIFPGYNFKQHKGYPTLQHKNALKSNNISIIHRKSFLKKIIINKKESKNGQQTIC